VELSGCLVADTKCLLAPAALAALLLSNPYQHLPPTPLPTPTLTPPILLTPPPPPPAHHRPLPLNSSTNRQQCRPPQLEPPPRGCHHAPLPLSLLYRRLPPPPLLPPRAAQKPLPCLLRRHPTLLHHAREAASISPAIRITVITITVTIATATAAARMGARPRGPPAATVASTIASGRPLLTPWLPLRVMVAFPRQRPVPFRYPASHRHRHRRIIIITTTHITEP